MQCRLLVPTNLGVCVYLKSTGMFSTLQQANVEVDDRGIPSRPNPQSILPLKAFRSEAEVDHLANEALETLMNSGLGAPNLRPIVSEVFAELALNAVQHAESPIGAFGLVQFYDFQQGRRFVCAVADGGIGIRKSLERNPLLRDRVPYLNRKDAEGFRVAFVNVPSGLSDTFAVITRTHNVEMVQNGVGVWLISNCDSAGTPMATPKSKR